MANSGGITASLPGRYASALFDLASESGSVSTVEGDLASFAEALRESADLAALTRNPRIGRDAAARAIGAVADALALSPLTRNFLGVLAANRRLGGVADIIRAFHTIAAAARGEVTAEVVSARPLVAEQREALRRKLEARQGRAVTLRDRVDPDLLGGLVVTIGSQRIDSSIRTRLDSLARAMRG